MKRKIVFFSTIVAILLVLGGLSPTICSKDLVIASGNETVTIEVNRYYGKNSEEILTEISYEDAEEIKEILVNLNEAIVNNDEEAISQYESILNEKGIFGNNYQDFFSYNTFSEMMDKSKCSQFTRYFGINNNDNISNYMCYFNAIGKGTMLFTLGLTLWEAIVRAVQNASSPLAGLIIFLALFPFLVLIMIFTHLIPFRILMPRGAITMQNGTISSLGLMGFKRVVVGTDPVDVNLSWFTGLTINFPFGENPFLFVSGVALEVKETDI
jgi:hypothetical protein